MRLQEAQQLIDEWIRTHGVRYFSELTNMAITEEVGSGPYHRQNLVNNPSGERPQGGAGGWRMCSGVALSGQPDRC